MESRSTLGLVASLAFPYHFPASIGELNLGDEPLYISLKTIETCRKKIMNKLNLHSIAELPNMPSEKASPLCSLTIEAAFS